MNPLERFMHAYLHYTVTQRLFEDTCRQLRDTGGAEERRALVDEALRLAMAVSELTEDVEALMPGARSYAARHDVGDVDILDAFELIANSIEEDRARATSFAMFLTARRMGGSRKPRPPQVANPMRFAHEDEVPDDSEIPEEEDESEEESNEEDAESEEENDAESEEDEDDSGCRETDGPDDEGPCDSDCSEEDDGEDDSDDGEPHQSAYRRRLMIEEENSRADDPFIFYNGEEEEPKGNPLVEESNRIVMRQRQGSVSPEEMDEMRRRLEESRWTSRPSSPSCWHSHPWQPSRWGSACAPTYTWCSRTATP